VGGTEKPPTYSGLEIKILKSPLAAKDKEQSPGRGRGGSRVNFVCFTKNVVKIGSFLM